MSYIFILHIHRVEKQQLRRLYLQLSFQQRKVGEVTFPSMARQQVKGLIAGMRYWYKFTFNGKAF